MLHILARRKKKKRGHTTWAMKDVSVRTSKDWNGIADGGNGMSKGLEVRTPGAYRISLSHMA